MRNTYFYTNLVTGVLYTQCTHCNIVRGKKYPFVANVLGLFALGCARKVIPLPEEVRTLYTSYFTSNAWSTLLHGLYPSAKIENINEQCEQYELHLCSTSIPFYPHFTHKLSEHTYMMLQWNLHAYRVLLNVAHAGEVTIFSKEDTNEQMYACVHLSYQNSLFI